MQYGEGMRELERWNSCAWERVHFLKVHGDDGEGRYLDAFCSTACLPSLAKAFFPPLPTSWRIIFSRCCLLPFPDPPYAFNSWASFFQCYLSYLFAFYSSYNFNCNFGNKLLVIHFDGWKKEGNCLLLVLLNIEFEVTGWGWSYNLSHIYLSLYVNYIIIILIL